MGCVYVCRLGISSGELRATKCFLLQVSADFTYIHICSVVSKLEPNSTCRGRNSIQSKLPSFYRDVARPIIVKYVSQRKCWKRRHCFNK